MKVLYISPFDSSGYGEAAVRYVHALRAAGVEVACRRLDLGRALHEDALVRELLGAPLGGVTHCVQHTLPTHYVYHSAFKNLGLFANETKEVPKRWKRRLRWMDCQVCVCHDQRFALGTEFNGRAATIGHPCDLARYDRRYETPDWLRPYRERGYYVYYGVGEFVRRKNWATALRAYLTAFTRADPVLFVLKSSIPGLGPAESLGRVEKFVADLAAGMKLGHPARAAEVKVVSGHMGEAELLGLHASCDCYVSTSHGEAWNLPGMDAAGLGRTLVVPQEGGFREYADADHTVWLEPLRDHCFGGTDAPAEVYSGHDCWDTFLVADVAQALRKARFYKMPPAQHAPVREFSYEKIGVRFREVLAAVSRR